MNYAFEQTVKMIAGWDSITQLPALLADEGFQRPLIVCDQSVVQLGLLERIEKLLQQQNIPAAVFDKVQPDPPADIIDEGAAFCASHCCDCIIAVGGGSTIDTAKGINLLRFNYGKILDYTKEGAVSKPTSGLICIPTTAGTGSELSMGMIVTNTETSQKLALHAYGEFAIVDPALTATMPASLTVNTGLDVFSHAFEAYTSLASNPMADAVCEKVMAEVFEWLPVAKNEPDNQTARQRMAVASSLGGWMLSNGCAHIGHSMAHVLGAKFHLPHGLVCSYTLPVTIETVADVLPEKVRYTGRILGVDFPKNVSPQQIGRLTAQAYRAFRDRLYDGKTCSFPIDESNIHTLAQEICKEAFAPLTPVKVDEALVVEMLKKIG